MQCIGDYMSGALSGIQVVGANLKAWATPIGVVVAAFISFTALFFTNRANLKAEREKLTATLAAEETRSSNALKSQERAALESFRAQRQIAHDGLLLQKRSEVYPHLMTAASKVVSTLRNRVGGPNGGVVVIATLDTALEPFVEYLFDNVPHAFLFGDDEVKKLFRTLLDHASALQRRLGEGKAAGDQVLPVEDVRPYVEQMGAAQNRLNTALSSSITLLPSVSPLLGEDRG